MDTLQEFLSGKRSEPLDTVTTARLITDCSKYTTYGSLSQAHASVVVGIERRGIDPDKLLIAAIDTVRSKKDYIMVGIALRYANPNVYVNTPGLGPAHIIIHMISVLRNNSIDMVYINTLYTMLVMMGSRPTMYAFDSLGGQIPRPEIINAAVVDTAFIETVSRASLVSGSSSSFASPSSPLSSYASPVILSENPVAASSPSSSFSSPMVSSPMVYLATPVASSSSSMTPFTSGSFSASSSPVSPGRMVSTINASQSASTSSISPSRMISTVSDPSIMEFKAQPLDFATMRNMPNRVTVQEWMQQQGGFSHLLDSVSFINRLSVDSKTNLGVLCDKPEWVSYHRPGSDSSRESPSGPHLDNIIVSRAIKVGKKLPVATGEHFTVEEYGEYMAMTHCVKAVFPELFIYFYDHGLVIDYFLATQICLSLRAHVKTGNVVLVQGLQDMLLYAVRHGVTLDTEQMAIISTSSEAIANTVIMEYKRPNWSKVCMAPVIDSPFRDTVPKSVRHLAFSLNIDPSLPKTQLCDRLSHLSQIEPTLLKEAYIRRQRSRATSTVSSIEEYLDTTPQELQCQNRTVLQADPFGYNDASMTYYTENKQLWCFTSNMYESLIEEKINPYTRTALPSNFINQVSHQLDILKAIGVNPSTPASALQAVDSLRENDDITGRESQSIVDTIIRTAAIAGITEIQIRRLNATQMGEILNTISMPVPYLGELTPLHRLIVFCRAGYFAIKNNNEYAKVFFRNIQLTPIM